MMASAATVITNTIEKAHQLYRDGRHNEALVFYTGALAMAKTKAQKIALHSNRAACYLKLQDFKKAAEECTSVLELDHNHCGALMLRAQTLVTLKEYRSALFDVNRLMELDPSSDAYSNLQARLKTQLSLAPIPESEEEALASECEEAMEDDLGDESVEDEPEEERREPVLVQEKTQGAVATSGQKAEIPIVNPQDPMLRSEGPKDSCNLPPKGWEAIPKPKGHSGLDYSRWDRVEDDSSEDEDEAEDVQPHYRFRVRTVGVRPVK